METYERYYTTAEEAKQAAQITGGTISTFYSMDEDGAPILIYCVKYKELF